MASQIYSHKCGFNAPSRLERANGEKVRYSLSDFINEYGAPEHLTYDGAAVQMGSKTRVVDNIRKHEIKTHISGPQRPNENPTEGLIREIKKQWYWMKAKKNIPNRLWDFGISYLCETGNITANSSRYADGRTPIEIITGETTAISEYVDFGFYDWVTYKSNAGVDAPQLGKWLGVSHQMLRIV